VRSLAAAESDPNKRDRKHQERERFSVAAIAFCFKHDPVFKSHFLKAIADLPPESIPEDIVEPHKWGDLVLEGPRHVLVLEFKLGALLQDHQSPDALIFSENGYGAQIRARYGESGKELRYIVIGKSGKAREVKGLKCSVVPWSKLLLPAYREESPLETDLYDCLGYLGAPIFLYRRMESTQLTADAHRAMNVFGMLLLVLDEKNITAGSSTSGHDYIGVDMKKAGAAPGSLELAKLVRPSGHTVGWIGYEVDEEEEHPRLSVWFYSTSASAPQVKRRLEAAIQRKAMTGEVEQNEENHHVFVSLPGKQSKDDKAWFQKVLRAAIKKS
jgi:hypothetical protein